MRRPAVMFGGVLLAIGTVSMLGQGAAALTCGIVGGPGDGRKVVLGTIEPVPAWEGYVAGTIVAVM